jgi:hypothetical protein
LTHQIREKEEKLRILSASRARSRERLMAATVAQVLKYHQDHLLMESDSLSQWGFDFGLFVF